MTTVTTLPHMGRPDTMSDDEWATELNLRQLIVDAGVSLEDMSKIRSSFSHVKVALKAMIDVLTEVHERTPALTSSIVLSFQAGTTVQDYNDIALFASAKVRNVKGPERGLYLHKALSELGQGVGFDPLEQMLQMMIEGANNATEEASDDVH